MPTSRPSQDRSPSGLIITDSIAFFSKAKNLKAAGKFIDFFYQDAVQGQVRPAHRLPARDADRSQGPVLEHAAVQALNAAALTAQPWPLVDDFDTLNTLVWNACEKVFQGQATPRTPSTPRQRQSTRRGECSIIRIAQGGLRAPLLFSGASRGGTVADATLSLRKRLWNPEARLAYLLLAPTALFLVFFMFYPIIYVFVMSFFRTNTLSHLARFVGLRELHRPVPG